MVRRAVVSVAAGERASSAAAYSGSTVCQTLPVLANLRPPRRPRVGARHVNPRCPAGISTRPANHVHACGLPRSPPRSTRGIRSRRHVSRSARQPPEALNSPALCVADRRRASGETAPQPPETEPGQEEGQAGEDGQLIPLQRPVPAGGLVGHHFGDPQLGKALLYRPLECGAGLPAASSAGRGREPVGTDPTPWSLVRPSPAGPNRIPNLPPP